MGKQKVTFDLPPASIRIPPLGETDQEPEEPRIPAKVVELLQAGDLLAIRDELAQVLAIEGYAGKHAADILIEVVTTEREFRPIADDLELAKRDQEMASRESTQLARLRPATAKDAIDLAHAEKEVEQRWGQAARRAGEAKNATEIVAWCRSYLPEVFEETNTSDRVCGCIAYAPKLVTLLQRYKLDMGKPNSWMELGQNVEPTPKQRRRIIARDGGTR